MPTPRRRAPHRRPGGVVAALLGAVLALAACTGPSAATDVATLDPQATAIPAPIPPPSAGTSSARPATQPIPTATATPTATPTAAATPPMAEPADAAGVRSVLGTFDVALAPEISGIVASRRDPDLLWLLDDGPGTTSVVAIRTNGDLVARVQMDGVEGRDTEGLAAGPCAAQDPAPCLFVGDIGDNSGLRERILVHRFPEPATDVTSTAVTTASFTHPGGPVDAEALLVGPDGLPVILTKEPDHARIMAATAFADGALVEVGVLAIPPPAQPVLTLFTRLTITAADVSRDGHRVLLRTYDHVVELTADQPGSPLSTLARWGATELPVAVEGQGEAIAYLDAAGSVVTASEGSGVLSVFRR